MMETQESLPLPEIEQQDTKKYKKHINDLIEDAEIEAEMEAEKKIRSKNSRVFSISMFGFGLLALVYLQINSQRATEGEVSEPIANPIESAEEKLAKQVPIVEDGASKIPFPSIKDPRKMIEPAKITPREKLPPIKKIKKAVKSQRKIKATSTPPKAKAKSKIAAPTNTRFFVQTGAFSLKKNAEASMKKLKAKGFSPLIHIVNKGEAKTYLVQLGVFPNKEKAKLAQEKLARAGYLKTIIK
ncbi:MAG: SPOR domain-containing protein [Nitrospina sp.]|jgi:cell division septation protein DedD|nr:SPOR domain-containing protein [Nitrospina sp.]MBT6717004.1 SPOR domain-containing protein [Nitrospina sp.]